MIATAHVIIGGAVGVGVGMLTGSPIAALAAGIASHFVCDSIPHLDHPHAPHDENGDLIWTPTIYRFAFSDSILAGLITLFLWYQFFDFPQVTPFILGAVGGYLPDFIDNVPYWNKYTRQWPVWKQVHHFHDQIHQMWKDRFSMPEHATLGIFTQVVCVGLSLWWLFKG